jgi:hypothetical protein
VLVDKTAPEPILGLKVNPRFGESFVIPMTARIAMETAPYCWRGRSDRFCHQRQVQVAHFGAEENRCRGWSRITTPPPPACSVFEQGRIGSANAVRVWTWAIAALPSRQRSHKVWH